MKKIEGKRPFISRCIKSGMTHTIERNSFCVPVQQRKICPPHHRRETRRDQTTFDPSRYMIIIHVGWVHVTVSLLPNYIVHHKTNWPNNKYLALLMPTLVETRERVKEKTDAINPFLPLPTPPLLDMLSQMQILFKLTISCWVRGNVCHHQLTIYL